MIEITIDGKKQYINKAYVVRVCESWFSEGRWTVELLDKGHFEIEESEALKIKETFNQ